MRKELATSFLRASLKPWSQKDAFELRLVLEVGMADLVVKRATDQDIEELSEIVKNEISPAGNIFILSRGSDIFSVGPLEKYPDEGKAR
jgi:DNA-binding FadR family transcriptional regulator